MSSWVKQGVKGVLQKESRSCPRHWKITSLIPSPKTLLSSLNLGSELHSFLVFQLTAKVYERKDIDSCVNYHISSAGNSYSTFWSYAHPQISLPILVLSQTYSYCCWKQPLSSCDLLGWLRIIFEFPFYLIISSKNSSWEGRLPSLPKWYPHDCHSPLLTLTFRSLTWSTALYLHPELLLPLYIQFSM